MFSNPEKNIAKLELKDGMKVADFGTGTGMYAKAVSVKVGETGKVYAIEVVKDLLKKLEDEVANWKIPNIDCIWGDIEKKHGTKIDDGILDAVVISNVLFQAEDRLGLIDESKRILKKGGKVLFVDWADSFSGMGPSVEYIVTEEEATLLFTSRGFKLLEKISVGDHHYGLIFIYE